MHRADDVLAGVADAWLQEVGDAAGDSIEDEAEFTSRSDCQNESFFISTPHPKTVS